MKNGGRTLLVVTSLVLAACGGSDGGTTAPEASTSPSAENLQDLAESGAVDEIAEAAGVSEACVQLSLAMAAAAGGMVPSESGDGSIDVEILNRSFDAIKGEAPADLQNDIEIVKNGMAQYLTVLAEYGNDMTALMMDPEAAERFTSVFENEQFSTASERFSAWMDTVCSQ